MAHVKRTYEMNEDVELFSLRDIERVVSATIERELKWGETVGDALVAQIIDDFRYVNMERFTWANCPGCVSSPDDCRVLTGDIVKKIWDGEVTTCPRRCNGTMILDADGLRGASLQTAYTPVKMDVLLKDGG